MRRRPFHQSAILAKATSGFIAGTSAKRLTAAVTRAISLGINIMNCLSQLAKPLFSHIADEHGKTPAKHATVAKFGHNRP